MVYAKYDTGAMAREFCEKTSMHGLKFIVQEGISMLERFVWMLCFIGGLVISIVLTYTIYEKWSASPVLITIQSSNARLFDSLYYFPTVTVCSVNKVSTRELGNWMDTPEGRGFELGDIQKILKIMTTSKRPVGTTNVHDYEVESKRLSRLLRDVGITAINKKYENLMQSISPRCSDMLAYCSWEELEADCNDLFETEATDDGYCCSFNSIVLKKTKNQTNLVKRLIKARAAGVRYGLSIILDAQVRDYNVTSSSFIGFKVSIQDPNDFPQTGQIGFLASPGHQVDAAVTGTMFSAAVDLNNYVNLADRKCAVQDEIELNWFEEYTGPYCLLDCKAQSLLQLCSCVPYYYPVPDELPVCELDAYPCIEQVLGSNTTCPHCEEKCDKIAFRNEISSGIYPNLIQEYPEALFRRYNFQKEDLKTYAEENLVKLNVFMKSVAGTSYIMDQRVTWSDFVSSAGGVLGLGFGFSLISVIEVFYFSFIRWIFSKQPFNCNKTRHIFKRSSDLPNRKLRRPLYRNNIAHKRVQLHKKFVPWNPNQLHAWTVERPKSFQTHANIHN